MYPVSTDYKNKIQELDRIFNIEIRIEHSKGTLILGDKDIAIGSFVHHDSSQVGDEFTVGGVYASNIEFQLVNRGQYEDIDFIGARVYPKIGLLLEEQIDAHFLQPSQPSKMKDFEDKWEYVSLGVFNIDVADKNRSTINIKAIDNMIFLDKPYSVSNLSYPATLYQIYVNICNIGDFGIGTPNFINKDYVVQKRPTGDLTLRNVLGFVAELSGGFAKFNRFGNLELKWYTPSGVTITPDHRSKFIPKDFQVQITGVAFGTGEKDSNDKDIVYLTGTDDYALDLTGNVLLQGGYDTVLLNIFNKIKSLKFIPYSADWHGNPAMQAGDIITHIDVDDNIYNTIITNTSYKYRGTSTLSGKGLPNISRGFKSTDNRITSIIQKVENDIGDKLTTLEQAQLNATELMANMLGGHLIIDNENGDIYIANKPTLSQATEYWKWGLGGFAHYVNGQLDTSITADGTIVAMLVASNIITANMIETGILSSKDGSTHLNLDNGSFTFKNQFSLGDNGVDLNIGDPDSGNYISMTAGDPLNVYNNNVKMLELWVHRNLGGYILVNNSVGRQNLRIQGTGSNNKIDFMCDDLVFKGSTYANVSNRKITFDLPITMSNEDITLNRGNVNTRLYTDGITFSNSGGGSYDYEISNVGGGISLRCKDFYVMGGGTKSAVVDTEHYGNRFLYCEESDRVYFNTKGVVETTNCKYIIRLDDAFVETIEPNSKYPYIINITPYANTGIWVKDVFDKYIIIESEDNCKFAYNIQCTRKDYGDVYLEERNLREERMNNRRESNEL